MMKLSLYAILGVWACSTLTAGNWPNWRGPNSDGTTPETKFPTEWNREKNVLWRVDLPEPGNSSPIVWQDKVFITQALEKGRRRLLRCYDRKNGQLLWEAGPSFHGQETTHETNPYCSASPVTDGKMVVASFASAGVYAYDMDGKALWHADLGPQKHLWGQGSSPVLHGGRCFVYHGPGQPSTLFGLDKRTGRIEWETAIPEVHPPERFDGFAGKNDGMMGSFATPSVVRAAGRDELIVPVSNKLRAHDPATGKELWTCAGLSPLVYSSITFGDGLLMVMGGYFGSTMTVKPGGHGDVTATHRLWHEQRAKKHRICSPVVKDGLVYVYNTIGVFECMDLATGRLLWEERIKPTGASGESWASLVLSGDKLFGVNQSGDTVVLRASPKFELIATNPLGEYSNSTPAFSNGQIFQRTHKALWCIGEGKKR